MHNLSPGMVTTGEGAFFFEGLCLCRTSQGYACSQLPTCGPEVLYHQAAQLYSCSCLSHSPLTVMQANKHDAHDCLACEAACAVPHILLAPLLTAPRAELLMAGADTPSSKFFINCLVGCSRVPARPALRTACSPGSRMLSACTCHVCELFAY